MNTPNRPSVDAQTKSKQLWIGLVEVRSLKDKSEILEDTKGAFVNMVTWASDAVEYKCNVELIAHKLGLFVSDVENPEPVETRRKNNTIVFDEEIEDMISRAQGNPKAIIYGTFHTFEEDNA
jgi:hypothetical protein